MIKIKQFEKLQILYKTLLWLRLHKIKISSYNYHEGVLPEPNSDLAMLLKDSLNWLKPPK